MQWKEKISLVASPLEKIEVTNGKGATMTQEKGFERLLAAALQLRDTRHTFFFIRNGAVLIFILRAKLTAWLNPDKGLYCTIGWIY